MDRARLFGLWGVKSKGPISRLTLLKLMETAKPNGIRLSSTTSDAIQAYRHIRLKKCLKKGDFLN
jgi:hypothetical protein